ncbi:MAG: hypothetical protein IPG89_09720 [Bacteroidetes bacterium]|nr:hypothetical protein [Bacteroidota bacterium]
MNLFLKITITLCLVAGSIFLLDNFYSSSLRANKNTKADYVSSTKIDADILIHGPCEPLWMVNPEQLDTFTGKKSYNLALSHSDFADNYLHLYLYLKNNKAPKLILLYVTPESMDKKFNTFNSYRFAQYLADDVVAKVVSECDVEYYRSTTIPYFAYAYYNKQITFNALQGLKHKKNKRALPFFANGFEPPAKITWDNHLEDMQLQYPQGYEFKIDSLRVKYLKKTIELAKQYGSEIILYESPVLTESLTNLKNREETIKFIKQLAAKENVGYILFKDENLSSSRTNYILL